MTAPAGRLVNRRSVAVAASVIVVAGGMVALATLGDDDPDRTSPTPIEPAIVTIDDPIPPVADDFAFELERWSISLASH